ncbi:MAG: hypothetical protein ACLPY1_15570 [Terracidiphilus sp.]
MKRLLTLLIIFTAQMNTLQVKPVVHLQPHKNSIGTEFGGDLVELINAPTQVLLPLQPPSQDSQGDPWSVDVKNLGPNTVQVSGKAQFSVQISVGETVHIYSNGSVYRLKR